MNENTHELKESSRSFLIRSEQELIESFSDKDQKKLILPKNVSYPVKADPYYAWREPSGVYVYLVFKKPEWNAPVGLVFKRAYTGSTINNSRLCDWCLSYGTSDQVGMLSLSLNSRESIGMMLCLDLGCAHRLAEASELSGKSFEKLIQQLYERVGRFFDGVIRERRNVVLSSH